MDQQLPTQLLPAVHHFTFSIFNVAVPNLIMWGIVVILFFVGAWARLPRLFERPERGDQRWDAGGSTDSGRSASRNAGGDV